MLFLLNRKGSVPTDCPSLGSFQQSYKDPSCLQGDLSCLLSNSCSDLQGSHGLGCLDKGIVVKAFAPVSPGSLFVLGHVGVAFIARAGCVSYGLAIASETSLPLTDTLEKSQLVTISEIYIHPERRVLTVGYPWSLGFSSLVIIVDFLSPNFQLEASFLACCLLC